MNVIEIIGFITAVLGIYLTAKKNIYAWPILIISSLAYAYFFYEIKLYADAVLQFFFVGTSVFAWINWSDNLKSSKQLIVHSLPFHKLIGYVFVALLIGKFFGVILNKYTDASYAEYDSLLFASSILASILSAKLILENWYLWIVINLLYILLYLNKQAYLTAVLYSILVVLAITGLQQWKKIKHV